MTHSIEVGISSSKLILFIYAVFSKNKSNFSGRLHFQSLELDGSVQMKTRLHIQLTKKFFSLWRVLLLADEVIGLDTMNLHAAVIFYMQNMHSVYTVWTKA